MREGRLELPTSELSPRRSSQLSYTRFLMNGVRIEPTPYVSPHPVTMKLATANPSGVAYALTNELPVLSYEHGGTPTHDLPTCCIRV